MAANSNVTDVTDATFDAAVINSDIPVIVDFWATWCVPCKAIAPILGDLSVAYAGKVKVVKLNTDDNQQVAARFGVMNLPTLLVFKKGQVVNQHVGAAPRAKLEKLFQAVL